jgi:hypothetical protein
MWNMGREHVLKYVKKKKEELCSRRRESSAIVSGQDRGKERWAESLTAKQYRHLRNPKCWRRRW